MCGLGMTSSSSSRLPGGDIRRYQGYCRHQKTRLADGRMDGCILTCAAHSWQFDVSMGEGVNPNSCRLDRYDLKIEDAAISVCFRQSILGSFSVSSTYLRPSSPERCRRTKFQWISIKRHAAATALLNVSRVIVSKDNEQRHTRSPATRSSQLPCHCHRPHWMS
jgi:Rieske 2Fe-2S protein